MAFAKVIDLTDKINSSDSLTCTIDIGSADYIIVEGASGNNDVSVYTSSDGGAVEGVTFGNALSATGFTACFGIDMSVASPVANLITVVTGNNRAKFVNISKYMQFVASDPVTKLLVRIYQPQ